MSGYLWTSQTVHGFAVKIGLEYDVFVSGALVNIYSKFGRLRDAWVLFDDMPGTERDVVLWNVMLKACAQMGLKEETFLLFSELHHSGLRPNDVSVRCVLGGVSQDNFVEGDKLAEQVQAFTIKLFLHDHTSDVILWNKTLSQYHQAGENYSAVECFLNMHRSNLGYDSMTLAVALAATTGLNDLVLGQQIHGMAVKFGFDLDVTVANILINMYSKIGYLSFARKVFTVTEELDLVSWNSMISGLCLSKQVHAHALITGIITDTFVSTALIDVYSRSRRMEDAELLFQSKDEFDLASLNAMMFGYIICGNSRRALELFALMHKSGERSDEITLATVAKACGCLVGLEEGRQIHAHVMKVGVDLDICVSGGLLDIYIKCGDMVHACKVFQGIPAPDDVAWTAMISGCVENEDEDSALLIYNQMRQSGVPPDEYTFAILIKASSCLTALEQGRQIHANVIKSDCASDPFIGTSLIDMYAKCGNIEDSYRLFKRIDVRNITLWNAMLFGLAQHGYGGEALKLFKDMKFHGIEPDRVTFIGVLSACSYSGLVSEAYLYFDSMDKDYGIQPEIEHYSCLVDAFSRAGLVQEAENLIASMPFEASASMYRALLGACWVQRDMETGKRVATQLLSLEPFDSSAYVLLSNIYAAANQWDEVTDAREMMKVKLLEQWYNSISSRLKAKKFSIYYLYSYAGIQLSGLLSNIQNIGRTGDIVRDSFDVREALIAREIEKRRIREEITMAGILQRRRRELAAEYIRELMIKRELALRMGLLEHGINRRLLVNRPEGAGLGGLPFQRQPGANNGVAIKPGTKTIVVSIGSMSPNLENCLDGNQEDMEKLERHTDDLEKINGESPLDEKQTIGQLNNTNFKFLHKLCNFGTTSEASMAAHRTGKNYMTLLQENGGGVIAIKTVPDVVQYVNKNKAVPAKDEKEESLVSANREEYGVGAVQQENTDLDELATMKVI
ncbi:hypothetical protein F0562_007491 [Nyssa sinensis]|uniref:Uncharacterized protein n=1 Tax=Nyssa sinensis TaxID=561372 RepID=A0A5J5A8C4_9ASTE|nr:hypothetical protein F0562_007491 [Nyssa sinensis]